MKFLTQSLVLAGLALSATISSADITLDFNAILGSFYANMGSLKTPDNKSVAQQFADDTLQHYSGSPGNRVQLNCENPIVAGEGGATTTCEVIVEIYYRPHGANRGLKQTATYQIGLLIAGPEVDITGVKRTVSDPK